MTNQDGKRMIIVGQGKVHAHPAITVLNTPAIHEEDQRRDRFYAFMQPGLFENLIGNKSRKDMINYGNN